MMLFANESGSSDREGGNLQGFRRSSRALVLSAPTAFLSAIVVTQIANVFICRSARESVFRMGLLTNKLILAGIAVEIALILLIDYTPWGSAVFGTAPISLAVWLFIVPFAFGMLALEELRKWFARSRRDSAVSSAARSIQAWIGP
jgi:sodium/potassium-transporting ATPase subunit alpha